RYVTLQQIATFVRDGEDVQIIDNATKEDLTNVTLAQIVYEQEKQGDSGRARTLRGLIQLGSERLMSTFRDGPVGKLIARSARTASADKSLWDEPAPSPDAADERLVAVVASLLAPVQELQAEVRRLEGRIAELERAANRTKGTRSEKGVNSQ